jgi:hypothetical protein
MANARGQRVLTGMAILATSNTYNDWLLRHAFIVVPTQELVANFLGTFKKYPPRQRPASFSVDQIIDQFLRSTTPAGN